MKAVTHFQKPFINQEYAEGNGNDQREVTAFCSAYFPLGSLWICLCWLALLSFHSFDYDVLRHDALEIGNLPIVTKDFESF